MIEHIENMRNAYEMLFRQPEGMRPLPGDRHRCYGNMAANIKDAQRNTANAAAFLNESVTESSRKIHLKMYSMGSWFQWCICLKVVGKTVSQNVPEYLNFTDRFIILQDYFPVQF
jgi:hypothetical protein